MELFDDFKWAVAVFRARRMRKMMLFSHRLEFDNYVRPKTSDGGSDSSPRHNP
jgi:hypothetical protein